MIFRHPSLAKDLSILHCEHACVPPSGWGSNVQLCHQGPFRALDVCVAYTGVDPCRLVRPVNQFLLGGQIDPDATSKVAPSERPMGRPLGGQREERRRGSGVRSSCGRFTCRTSQQGSGWPCQAGAVRNRIVRRLR